MHSPLYDAIKVKFWKFTVCAYYSVYSMKQKLAPYCFSMESELLFRGIHCGSRVCGTVRWWLADGTRCYVGHYQQKTNEVSLHQVWRSWENNRYWITKWDISWQIFSLKLWPGTLTLPKDRQPDGQADTSTSTPHICYTHASQKSLAQSCSLRSPSGKVLRVNIVYVQFGRGHQGLMATSSAH